MLPPLRRRSVGDENVEGRGHEYRGERGEGLGGEDTIEGVDVREVEARAWLGVGRGRCGGVGVGVGVGGRRCAQG